jgi:hypothetical protein
MPAKSLSHSFAVGCDISAASALAFRQMPQHAGFADLARACHQNGLKEGAHAGKFSLQASCHAFHVAASLQA